MSFSQNWSWKFDNNSKASENFGSSKYTQINFKVFYNGHYQTTKNIDIWYVYSDQIHTIEIDKKRVRKYDRKYKFVSGTNVSTTVGNQTWFSENLAYKSKAAILYNNDQNNLLKHGRLYT